MVDNEVTIDQPILEAEGIFHMYKCMRTFQHSIKALNFYSQLEVVMLTHGLTMVWIPLHFD
jgi:hypothetical protein